MKEPFIVKVNPWKQIKLLFHFICFLLGGIFLFLTSEDDVFNRFVGIVTIVFFGAGFLIFCITWIQSREILILNEDGFIDNSSLFSRQDLFPWEQVEYMCHTSIHKQFFISIMPKDLDTFLDNLSPRAYKLAKTNLKWGYLPIQINLVSMKMKPEEVLALMEEYRTENQRKSN